MVEMKIPGMAYTVRLLQKAPDNYEVLILLHGQPETSTRARLLDKGSIRRAIATGMRQVGVSVSELGLENVARGLIEAAEKEGFPSEFDDASPSSMFDSFKETTTERLDLWPWSLLSGNVRDAQNRSNRAAVWRRVPSAEAKPVAFSLGPRVYRFTGYDRPLPWGLTCVTAVTQQKHGS